MSHLPFGAFNPRFHGISIFANEERLRQLSIYAEAPDPSAWVEKAGALSLEKISAISAIDHEMRHFHDFLISPLGATTMGLRMEASVSGLQAINLLGKCAGKWVPAPIGRWIRWDVAQRHNWINTIGQPFGIEFKDMVVLPHIPEDAPTLGGGGLYSVNEDMPAEEQLAQYALVAAGGYKYMEAIKTKRVEDFGIPITADSVFEATAHLVQLQSTYTAQSEKASQIFQKYIASSESPHLMVLNVLSLAFQDATGAVNVQRLCELFTWTMLGAPDKVMSTGHPAARCGGVLALLAQEPANPVFTAQVTSAAIFDELDKIYGVSDWRGNVAAAAVASDRRMALYERGAEHLQGGYFDGLFAVARHWHSDQAAARKTFLADPGSLSNPLRYIKESAYPRPIVELRLPTGIHERSEPVKSERIRAVSVDAEGLQNIGYTWQPPGKFPKGLLDAAHQTRLATQVMDFAFQDEPVTDTYDDYWRGVLSRMVGKRIVSLI